MKTIQKEKVFLWFTFVLLAIFIPIGFVSAGIFDVFVTNMPDPNEVAAELEARYHLNLGSMQDQGENFNVASQKGRAPEVLLYFSPSDPKPGLEVEARAFPEFFSSANDTLYYTWYLKRKSCGLDDSPGDEKRKLCDRNNDKKITVEDWKIEAMQIIAADSFDSTCSLNSSLSDAERKDCSDHMYDEDAPSRINPKGDKGRDEDEDGYIASFGGSGRSDFADSCSSSNPSSSSSSSSGTLAGSLTPSASPGTYLHVSNVPGGTTTRITLSPTETLYEIAGGFSEDTSEFCYEIAGLSRTQAHGFEWCSSGSGTWYSASNYMSSKDSMVYSGGVWTRTISPVTASGDFVAGKTYYLYWRDNTPLLASAELTVSDSGTSGTSGCSGHGACYLHDFGDGYNYELPSCKHVFPGNYRISSSGNIERSGDVGDDDGKFPIDEEYFWRTDPEDPSTAQNGNKDEANLAGLGQDTFKWVYAPEDMVGVAVEGPSMYNTKFDNSSMMIMWALPKNICEVEGKSSYSTPIKGYDVNIKTTSTDINECLPDNLVDPTEGGQSNKVELVLDYAPENPSAKLIPMNSTDPKEIALTGDNLVLEASSANASQSSSYTTYTWRVYASSEGTFDTRFNDQNVWIDITDDLKKVKSISTPNGNNVSSFSIDLNLPKENYTDSKTGDPMPGFGQYFIDDVGYFRVLVSATENFKGAVSQSGTAFAVVKIVANKSIDAYDVDSVVDPVTGLVSVERNDTVFCVKNTSQQTICPILNNQIIGVYLSTADKEVRDYQWTINEEPLICTSRVSSECSDEKQGAVNFFPVSGNVGDMYVVSVFANNSETGKSFSTSRRFQIVDPDADIISMNEEIAWPKYLGSYINLDGSETKEYSDTSFDGVPGGEVTFSPEFRPGFLGTLILNGIENGDNQNEIIWSVNGTPFKYNGTTLSLSLDGLVGDIYTVTLSGAYGQPRELRKALYDIWKISPFSSETARFSKEIQIRLVDGNNYVGKAKSNTFFASLISMVPPIVLFSVRLFLSMGLILFIVGFVFSLAPEKHSNGE